jgi:HrpA-like RNA helicase
MQKIIASVFCFRVSPKTVLTYCTDGVLLRTLMGGDSVLATVTHILVDEIHERNRFSDFLLIVLRDSLAKFRSLRLILMSATVDTPIFAKYFNNCHVIVGNVYVMFIVMCFV